MVDEYALREAFSKIRNEIDTLKKEIISLKNQLNESSYEDQIEELIEHEPIEQIMEEEINLTDSYY